MTMTASASEGLRILGKVPFSRLTTFKRDGTPVGVPIWQAVGDGKVYMFTEARSWKVKRLRRNPRIEITTCDWRGNLDGGPTWTGRRRPHVDRERAHRRGRGRHPPCVRSARRQVRLAEVDHRRALEAQRPLRCARDPRDHAR
jgi:PPOX class probable F420-dependent enzyme